MIMEDLKLLQLDEEYSFNVRVNDKNNKFAGKLTLTPMKCNLRVMSERRPSKDFIDSIYIECFSLRNKIILYNLKTAGLAWTLLERTVDSSIVYYEINFEVGYAVFSQNLSISNSMLVYGFEIAAPILYQWIGVTTNQNKLLYEENSNLNEFVLDLNGERVLVCAYNKSMHFNSLRISKGTEVVPVLYMGIKEGIEINNILKDFLQFYDYLTLFMGGDFLLKSITLNLHLESYQKISLYFPTDFQKINTLGVVLPLGHNLMSDSQDLKELNLECFENFYKLSNEKKELYSKFLRYKRLNSNEEKFLGYFRLLEKLTYHEELYLDDELLNALLNNSKLYLEKKLNTNKRTISSFIKRISKLNKSKYNAESCIRKFHESLTEDIKGNLDFDIKLLSNITKLRNDITHANPYDNDDNTLHKYSKFIHLLLCLALFTEVGVSFEVSGKIINRIKRNN